MNDIDRASYGAQVNSLKSRVAALTERLELTEARARDMEQQRNTWRALGRKQAKAEVAALEARAQELEAALEPFAAAADDLIGKHDTRSLAYEHKGAWRRLPLSASTLRAARRAVRGQAQGQGGGE